MSESLSNSELKRWAAVRADDAGRLSREVLALRARVAKLETALLDCKRYAEDHDDEWVPYRVDEALSQTPDAEKGEK